MKSIKECLAVFVCLAACSTVASGSEYCAVSGDIAKKEWMLWEEAAELRKRIEPLKKKLGNLNSELEGLDKEAERKRTAAVSDYRNGLKESGLSDSDKAGLKESYEKRIREIDSWLVKERERLEFLKTPIKDQLWSRWGRSGLISQLKEKDQALAKLVEEAAPGSVDRLLANGMVKIPDKEFLIAKFEVTQALWFEVMGENPSHFESPSLPVESVSWDDCQEFLNKINVMPSVIEAGFEFRLPTRAEWEYACRAGASCERPWWTGNRPYCDYCRLSDGTEIMESTLGQVAWFEDNSDAKTHPVGQKAPNAFGLYDMLGNVREWTDTEWTNDTDVANRVFLGGGWKDSDFECMSSNPDWTWPSLRFFDIGFRLCASGESVMSDTEAKAVAEERRAREERAAAVRRRNEEARQTALSWKSESKRIELSETIAIDLQSVPGGLWFGKFEVTQAQWEAVMGENPSFFKGENNPVQKVSWDDCQVFLKKLNALPAVKESGLTFRLPTDAEWEYACRAGATGDFCRLADGTEITESTLGMVAWFVDEHSYGKTHAHHVGRKKPNAFGLYDMHGNVWEWTATADGVYRVFRGGGGPDSAGFCESSFRNWDSPSCRRNFLGFRLCASPVITAISAGMVQIPGTDFKMGKFEVTQAQWEAVMGENPSRFKDPNNPVENVSWNDCQEFLKELNALPDVKKSGLVFRLPTEEEWAYACRAGATGDYCKLADGTEITEKTLGEVAWFDDNSDEMTHPVGQKQPNAFGLYDMHGNVWEWTSTAVGEDRVTRGGSWLFSAGYCVSSDRYGSLPSNRLNNLGFRLCASGRADEAQASKSALSGASGGKASRAERSGEDSTSVAISPAIEAICLNMVQIHMVQIPGKDYKMGKTEVTQAQWEAVMGENPSRFKGENNPVENVSWNDCQEFLRKLNALPSVKKSGLTFRLPTEEEWEYACRAGATGEYCLYCLLSDGMEITRSMLGQVAWFKDNSDEKTHPVGEKQPNAFGLYDMHGNVMEWTSTAYDGRRVNRGGSWNSLVWFCESSWQCSDSASSRSDLIGFRLCASGRAD